jgi:hypothetical protein
VVPAALLLAACAVLRDASSEVLEDLRANPRRSGNPAKRLQALSDARTADDIEEGLEVRLSLLRLLDAADVSNDTPGSGWASAAAAHSEWAMAAARQAGEVERMSALGPNQWRVITAVADTWRRTVDELVTLARATYLDEVPFDLELWQRWTWGTPNDQVG